VYYVTESFIACQEISLFATLVGCGDVHFLRTSKYIDLAAEWMIWGTNLGRGKGFFPSPKRSFGLWSVPSWSEGTGVHSRGYVNLTILLRLVLR
jgi:hypothetical protein